MTKGDLTTLADVKAWLGRGDTNSDALLAALITRASRAVCSYLQRPILLPRSITEIRGGTGTNTLLLREWPVLSVASLTIDGIAIPQASTQQPGWTLEGWSGAPPGRPQALSLRGGSFGSPLGRNVANVEVTYQAGYQITAEPQTVSEGIAEVLAPYGEWASDMGVCYADGVPLAKVAGAPARGQYALDAEAGTYDFNAADNGQAVTITYGYVPTDIADACIELVAERYKYSQRVGEKSHSLAGNETVSFDTTRFTPLIVSLLAPYRAIAPV